MLITSIGLLSLDLLSLKVFSDSGTGETKRYARRLFPIIRRHHWLLVTLLLGNAACVEAMPIFLDRVSDPVTAILVSVTAVLLFGEVIPQALCTRYGLKIGYYCSPIVYVFMALLSPIAFPIAKLLDCLLGSDHETVFKREEIKSLVSFHGPEIKRLSRGGRADRIRSSSLLLSNALGIKTDSDEHRRSVLTRDEVLIIQGALELTNITAGDACTPIDKVFMLSDQLSLDSDTRRQILQSAHSRVPVYHADNREDIRGHLLVKMLLMYETSDSPTIQEVMTNRRCFREMPFVKSTAQLHDLLRIFQMGNSYMAVVLDNDPASPVSVRGIITRENVLEKLLFDSVPEDNENYNDLSHSEQPDSSIRLGKSHVTMSNSYRQVSINGYQVNRITVSKTNKVGEASEVCGGNSTKVEVTTTRDTERTPLLMGQKLV